jgi:hypothetical protein
VGKVCRLNVHRWQELGDHPSLHLPCYWIFGALEAKAEDREAPVTSVTSSDFLFQGGITPSSSVSVGAEKMWLDTDGL